MADAWRFDRFTFEPGEGRLSVDGADVDLGARALEVLRILVERAGHLVTKSELLDLAWPGLVVEENNLQVQVSALRKALGPGAIATVAGRGYRFQWPVSRDATPTETAPVTQTAACPLPAPFSPLVGRAAELDDLVAMCGNQRLVSVVGPGGIGKTRLAIEAARVLRGTRRADRIVFCDLTSVTGGSLVPAALAAAAGVPCNEVDPLIALRQHLADAHVLLLIDNAEHVRGAVAEVVRDLLLSAATCRALVTSQVPLDLPGESLLRIEPLTYPVIATSLEETATYGAVEFFVSCARAVDRRFTLRAENLATVVSICRKLDGIPLALQLAAARVSQVGLSGLDARLDQRLRLLSRPGSPVPSRQQTLAAALDWSYQLLEPDLQAQLRQLGVFAGTFDLADAIAIARDADGVHTEEALAALVERSLADTTDEDPPRYRLLETVRLYALERLLAAGETDVIDRAISHHEARAKRHLETDGGARAALDYAVALELCGRLPRDPARDRRELALLLELGPAVQASSSPGCSRCEDIYGRAVELARRGEDGTLRFQALWGYWQFLAMAGRDREAAPLSIELGALADAIGDDALLLEASHAQFSTSQLLGDARATLAHTQAAMARYDRERHHSLTHEYGGHDPGVCAFGQGSVALWLCGLPDQAMVLAAEAERLGSSFDHPYSRAVGYYYTAMTYGECGEIASLSRVAAALVDISSAFSMDVLLTEGHLFAGHAAFERGDRERGLAQLAASYEKIVAAQDFGFVPYYATLLASAYLHVGNLDGVDRVVAEAFVVAEAGQGFFLPEVHRLRGDLALARGKRAEAREAYRHARSIAYGQGARSLELRARTSEARLLAEAGARDEARRLLDELLNDWTEGFQTRDVRDARGLRNRLS